MTEPAQSPSNPPSGPEPSWAGCVVPGVVLMIFLSLGIWAVAVGYLQSKGFDAFLDKEPLVFEVTPPSAEALAHATAAIEQIRRAATEGAEVEVPLTVEDLNTLLVTAPLLDSYRTTGRVRRITSRGLEAELSQELKGKRFLNGVFRFTPAKSETNTWQLLLEDIEVPGREVPDPFILGYRNLHMFRFDSDLPDLQTVLKRIDAIRLEEGCILVHVPAKDEG
jgi:hypothetical protein